MADIRELIAHFDDDSDDQRQLIALIGRIVEPVLRKALERWHRPIQELEDLRQEFFAERVRRKWKELKDFRGSTEASFVAYWHKIAWKFGVRHFEQRVKRQQRELRAVASHAPHDGSGASEAEILAMITEIEARLTPSQRGLLRRFMQSQGGLGPAADKSAPASGRDDGADRPGSGHAWLTRLGRLRRSIERFLWGEE